ncbi:MAG: type II toxin-antitoxin system RelE/ParE family toxin [Parcubacteria group bacterium CG08_land_8_20_14_0_20_43_9]|nr:MAG: type II toxin-antitoxin system RelE/ParE family toxin [Parcubacteria group bacterium CG08_land_8_20_14_0_20_43_9]
MIYSEDTEYGVKFYQDIKKNRSPVLDYIEQLSDKEKAKVLKYIEFLRTQKGYLEEPYSRHIKGKIRELRIDFGRNRHRIFYFIFIKKTIILLHAFLKKGQKIPAVEIRKAEENCLEVLKNQKIYE